MCIACETALLSLIGGTLSRRDVLRGLGTFGVTTALTGMGAAFAFAASDTGPADFIFTGGPVLTMDDRLPRAQAVAIRNGRILGVGSQAHVAPYGGAKTQVVDLQGRTLLPGFIDPHMHFSSVGLDDFIDVSPAVTPDMDAVMAALKAGVRNSKPGDWVRAQLFDPSITAHAYSPTLAELDALSPDNPLFLLEGNGHVAYVNSLAFKTVGITRDTPDIPTSRFVRGADGALTGKVEEVPAFKPFIVKMDMPDQNELAKSMARLMAKASSTGCTGLHDCGIGALMGGGDLRLLQSAMGKHPPVRVRGMLVSTSMKEWSAMGLKPGFGDDLFRVDGIKAWSDGSNQAQTGFMRAPYLGSTGRGALNYTPEALTDAIRQAHAGGWQVGVHANGDAGIDTTIAAFETVLRESPRRDHRHRIEHCSLLHPEQISKMVELGLSPSFLIGHVRYWGKAFRDRLLGPERAQFYDPCASALAAGLRISLHSDYSVTAIEPLRMVEDAVARVMHEGGEVLNANERIPVMAALKAVTLDAAWQCRMDHLTGSIEVGKYADFVILENDPTKVAPTAIRAIGVSETWLGGEKRYGI